jgi:hypothetical protein
MRPLLQLVLALSVALAAAGEGIYKPCACGCINAENQCPCGTSGDNPDPSFPEAPCRVHQTPDSSQAAICSGDIQIVKKSKSAAGWGGLIMPMGGMPEYSAHQPMIALRIDLLHGPPREAGFEKTNTRLAALSTLRI